MSEHVRVSQQFHRSGPWVVDGAEDANRQPKLFYTEDREEAERLAAAINALIEAKLAALRKELTQKEQAA